MNRHGIATAAALSMLLAMTGHGKKMSDKQCTVACVEHGSQYAFVSGDKVLKVSNQDFAGLKQFAGDTGQAHR